MEVTAANRTGGAFLIRDLRKSDLDDLLDLLPKCFAKEFEIKGFDAEHARAVFNRAFGPPGRLLLGSLRLLGKEPMKFLVAEADSEVVDTTFVERGEKSGYNCFLQPTLEVPRFELGLQTRTRSRSLRPTPFWSPNSAVDFSPLNVLTPHKDVQKKAQHSRCCKHVEQGWEAGPAELQIHGADVPF